MVDKMYDEFFGTGYWEKQYKQQIVIFAEKCIAESQKTVFNIDYAKCPKCGKNSCYIICGDEGCGDYATDIKDHFI